MANCGKQAHDRIRVLIVDDHAGVRSALAAFLASVDDLELAGLAASGEEAIRLCGLAQPDVILMDVSLPDMPGAAAIQSIHQRCPRAGVVATCTFQDEGLIPEALRAGAVGTLLKNVSAHELARAIRSAYAGRCQESHGA